MNIFGNLGFDEGWGIFETDDGVIQIQKLDEDEQARFKSDDEAYAYVEQRAEEGSWPHVAAIQYVEECHSSSLIRRQGKLLRAAVNILRGPPPEDTSWSHHDIAELAQRAMDRIKELEAALRKITATTYGSELSMSPEEHNEYFAQFYRQYRDIAFAALAPKEPTP
jgi:hypothetical protein